MSNVLNKVKNKFKKKYFKGSYDYGKEIYNAEQTNNIIREKILGNDPFMLSRIGSVELECLFEGIRRKKWTEETMIKMRRNAGFFPVNEKSLTKFNQLYIDCLKEVDLLGIWYNEGEDYVSRNYCKNALLSHLKDLEPYYHSNPWSEVLKGKKVLVIHPFEKSIRNQYTNKREQIFDNKAVLPEFQLKTIKAVQTISGNDSGFEDWFEAYESMCESIDKVDFDIAIIGAGAYGLPLAAYVKKIGKKAIHLGGATQILFGVKGARWEKHPFISTLFNDNWVRPLLEEQPSSFNEVEKGCYW